MTRSGSLLTIGLALSLATTALAMARDLETAIGKALFERTWVAAPASTDANDGLGPLFNAKSCAACHRSGGPAEIVRAADGKITERGLVLRFGTAAGLPDPYYGRQLQDRAVPGLTGEGRLSVTEAGGGRGDGGFAWALALVGPPLAAGIHTGLRLAPSLAGRADLARIDPAAILAASDPDDRDGDGISGRVRIAGQKDGRTQPGRFGWKAAVPDLPAQVAAAFALDMGLSSRAVPLPYGDCTPAQADCLAAPTGVRAGDGGHELDDTIILVVARFLETRTAPPPPDDPAAMRLFTAVGCAACHRPVLPDAAGTPVRAFTDLLLHDMGAGLDDGVGEPGVAAAEWRTAPLVDLGRRDGSRRYLHDGRAATIEQAIAAHAGEAAAARARFAALSSADRAALLQFLEGL